jgi:hypothetical protein
VISDTIALRVIIIRADVTITFELGKEVLIHTLERRMPSRQSALLKISLRSHPWQPLEY